VERAQRKNLHTQRRVKERRRKREKKNLVNEGEFRGIVYLSVTN
jgi:hypothetical protein